MRAEIIEAIADAGAGIADRVGPVFGRVASAIGTYIDTVVTFWSNLLSPIADSIASVFGGDLTGIMDNLS
ncbi:MAG: hypothetical protein HC883_03280, partial [Bdellovibrionaceae bacterium]|nr:hypothetical protein [Pseudobdellovibrionaceae bacterium]